MTLFQRQSWVRDNILSTGKDMMNVVHFSSRYLPEAGRDLSREIGKFILPESLAEQTSSFYDRIVKETPAEYGK